MQKLLYEKCSVLVACWPHQRSCSVSLCVVWLAGNRLCVVDFYGYPGKLSLAIPLVRHNEYR